MSLTGLCQTNGRRFSFQCAARSSVAEVSSATVPEAGWTRLSVNPVNQRLARLIEELALEE
jgi:hypothetical protein